MTKARRRLPRLVILAGVVHAFVMVLVLQQHGPTLSHGGEAVYIDPVGHWLRDSVLYLPVGVVLLLVATLLARRLAERWTVGGDGFGAVLLWAGLGAVVYALASVPGTIAHGALFSSTHTETPSWWQAAQQTILTLRYSFALLVALAMVTGVPWAARRRRAGRPSAISPPGRATTVRDR